MFLEGKILFEIRKPKIRDVISYTVFRSKYGDTRQVAIVLGWIDEESLRIWMIPEKEIRKIKWSPTLPNLRIITQDEIQQAISSVQNRK
jgi:hypothetical protein